MFDPQPPDVLPIGDKLAITAVLPCVSIDLGDGKKIGCPGLFEGR
jgi:hypothetical protein